MSSLEQIAVSQLQNQAFALMGRMHVILRRENGRIIDIEYMRTNAEYCRHLLTMAAQLPHDDLQQICGRLQEIYFGEDGLFVRAPLKPPLLERRQANAEANRIAQSQPAPAMNEASHADPSQAVESTYIGRLR
jgi:hypothetical protein